MKLKYEELLSNFAFNFSLRPYSANTASAPPLPPAWAYAVVVGTFCSVCFSYFLLLFILPQCALKVSLNQHLQQMNGG